MRARILLSLVLSAFSGAAFATTVFDSGTPQFVGTNISDIRAADNFILGTAATITDVRFYGSVFSGTFPGNFSGTISYVFYNNSSGSLGSVITSGTVNSLSGVSWGVCGAGTCYTVDFALNSATALAAGTYWLELHEGSAINSADDGSAITWAGLNNGTGSSLFSNSLATAPNTAATTDRAFLLFDKSVVGVPEPSTALLVIPGLVALAYYRRRRAA